MKHLIAIVALVVHGLLHQSVGASELSDDKFVRSFVKNYWNPSYEPVEAIDPQGPKSGFARAQRGGGWDTYCRTCNATSRSGSTEAYAGSQTGFRLTRVP